MESPRGNDDVRARYFDSTAQTMLLNHSGRGTVHLHGTGELQVALAVRAERALDALRREDDFRKAAALEDLVVHVPVAAGVSGLEALRIDDDTLKEEPFRMIRPFAPRLNRGVDFIRDFPIARPGGLRVTSTRPKGGFMTIRPGFSRAAIAGFLFFVAAGALAAGDAFAAESQSQGGSPSVTPAPSPSEESQGEADSGEDEGMVIRSRGIWFRDRHAGPDGLIPFRARSDAMAELRRNLASGLLKSSTMAVTGDTWVSAGPRALMWTPSTPFSGRVVSIAPHPTQPDTVYVGTAQGGVWKTTDGGTSWTPLTDGQASLAIGSLAIDPSNPNRIYAGTGEPFDGCGAYFGAGILRSDDAGAHWIQLAESTFGGTSVSRIVVHPSNPSILWATNAQGFSGFVCAAAPGAHAYGVWKSLDGGGTWSLVLGTTQTGVPTHTYELLIHPSNPSVLYAAVGASGIWKTTDGGSSWTKLAGGLPTANLGRADVALRPDAPETLYAVFEADSTSTHLGTWKSTNGGSTWSALPKITPGDICLTTPLSDICTYESLSFPGFCNYAMYVEVMPGGTVLLGGVGIWRSTNGGSSWINSCTEDMHVDHHAGRPDAIGRIWIGCDGGVYRSDDGGATWQSRSPGLVTAQFYPGASLHPTRRDFALGGTQDNGTYRSQAGEKAWSRVQNGDGGFSAVDPSNPDTTWYVTAQYLAIYKTTDGGATVQPAMNGLTDAGSLSAGFIAPIAICPANPSVLLAGSDNVWKTTNGAANWVNDSPDPLAGLLQTITTIAFSPSDSTCNTVFLGMANGRVYRTTVGGGGMAAWTYIGTGLPARGIAEVAVHPTNGNIVYVALSGFGTPHLYRSANALSATPTWTAISAGLPNTPVNAILLDPDDPGILYAGTDLGVFRSLDTGASWSVFMNGHPNVAVYDLVADSSTGALVSFTHGRGAWRLENCAVSCPPVGDTLMGIRGPSSAQFAWGEAGCSNHFNYEVLAATAYDAPYPSGWTVLGTPTAASFSDPLGSPWIAYRIRAVDRCGRTTAE